MEDSTTQLTWTVLHTYPTDVSVDTRWREFLSRAEHAAHYVSPEYFREPFFRDKRPFVMLVWEGERIVAAVSGIHEEHRLVCGLQSRPQICFDRTADLAAISDALANGLLDEAGPDKLITLYSWLPLNTLSKHGYQCKPEQGVVMLDLTKGPDELFKEFAPTRRTNVRNAIKRGVEVFTATTRDDFKAYYEIYTDWCERKKIPRCPFEVMEEAMSLPNRQLLLARYEGKIIATEITRLYPGGMIEAAANSSLGEYLKLKPNDLLLWRVIEWACAEGFKRYSLGGSHLFLRLTGGSIVPVYGYSFDRTWLHRYELKEALEKSGRNMFNALPGGLKTRVRRVLRHH
ncbi:MAG TPA: GNAT family N-acetyltransferase [Pyrinomonadaceae bacterium]|nr:GNAT family N-acetyltransferase [Pyrinomonadaceae bacterium]